jgi:astacin
MRSAKLSLVAALSVLASCAAKIDQTGASTEPDPQCVNTNIGRRCYQIVDGLALSGDIILGPASRFQGRSESSFMQVGGKKWPNNTVPYVIDSSVFTVDGLTRITDAIDEYNTKTTLRWVPRTNETDYARFSPSPSDIACSSQVGRVGNEQIIYVGTIGDCSVAHEMGHTLGLFHEMERPDRDQYVKVHFENLKPGSESQFAILTGDTSTPYDVASVMQYDAHAFTANGNATITRLDGSTTGLDYHWHLSTGDVAALDRAYAGGSTGGTPRWCGAMAVDERLGPLDGLFSCDDRSNLFLQEDGDLVLRHDDVVIWRSGTGGLDGQRFIMQGDGNLVLLSGAGAQVWASNTAGHPGATFFLQDDGNMVVQVGTAALPAGPPFPAPSGQLWASNTQLPSPPVGCGAVFAGEGLGPNQSVWSCDQRFQLVMQGDGNLVLYQGGIAGGSAIWSAGTDGKAGYAMWMQADGNLVLYSQTAPLFASNTAGQAGASLAIQDDGNLVVYAPDGHPVWASNTCCR